MVEATPGTIGRYTVDETLGTGAFATVYRASDPRLESTVAIKVLADNHSLDPELRERFLTEGRVLRRVDSAHVVRVHDLGETERQQPYLVLEHADRGTLAARVARLRKRGWRPTAADLLAVVRPLAGAVAAVHRANVVHRDLNPANVLLSGTFAPSTGPPATVVGDDERILLADLGLCKDLAVNSGFTASGGTEGFRAPEQRSGPAQVDARADLWSLSALVVWLLSDEPPAGGSVRAAVTTAGFAPALADVLDQSLADDPEDRHADVAAWLAAVEREVPAVPDTGPAGTGVRPGQPGAATRPPSRPRRRTGVLLGGAGATVLCAAAALGGWAWFGDGRDVTSLDGGDVRVAVADGEAEVAIEGPEEVAAGDTAEFTAAVDGVESAAWITPEGRVHGDASVLEVDTAAPGVATVTLVGALEHGEPLVVTHELRVSD